MELTEEERVTIIAALEYAIDHEEATEYARTNWRTLWARLMDE